METQNQGFAICIVAVAPLRAEGSDRSEMVSQVLFGEHVAVIGQTEKWWLVRNAYDQYEGWIDFRQLAAVSQDTYTELENGSPLVPLQAGLSVSHPQWGRTFLSPGSPLPFYDNGKLEFGGHHFTVDFQPHTPGLSDLVKTARFFQNTPYLWGGRNISGIDCSGFCQAVYRLNGIRLRRDASQQAEHGSLVAFLAEARDGDLAFFDNEQGRITHVGLMMGNDTIIHASGKVRIDRIDDEGIFNAELGKYSHRLRIIKRLVE
ncbi:C40 family peptidase [Pedobacter sp. SYP-B3415]|uniref:C40 family peptidase n=1 Tax=Pedobacter sp. SYP-B3415 TaxID=2496641 RepID=UPI00101B650B|nr:C40 family peptidase [Pedobacter sp. SYP-B3415]